MIYNNIIKKKLTFIYSLDTLWYSVRNLDVAQEHLWSDAFPDTTVIRQESATGLLVRKTYALPIAPRPLPIII